MGSADLMLEETDSASPASKRIQDIIELAERGGDLCRQMSIYSEAGDVEAETLNLSEAIQAVPQRSERRPPP